MTESDFTKSTETNETPDSDFAAALRELDERLGSNANSLEPKKITAEGMECITVQRIWRKRRRNATLSVLTVAAIVFLWSYQDMPHSSVSKAISAYAKESEELGPRGRSQTASTVVTARQASEAFLASSKKLRSETEQLLAECRRLTAQVEWKAPIDHAVIVAVAHANDRLENGADSADTEEVRKQLETLRDEFPDTVGAKRANEILTHLTFHSSS